MSACFLFISISAYSYKGPPPPAPPANPGLPIDGGLIYLFIAGVVYGVHKLKK